VKFILFDIDGTLIDSGGAGVRSLNLAFQEMFSIRDAFSMISVAGKTDLQIIREGLQYHGITHHNGSIPAVIETYVKHLKANIDGTRGHVKRGIKEGLSLLKSCEDYVLGLLTGNVEEGAYVKLETFGLRSYFDVGAFGSDDEDRNRLLPLAVEKLRRRRAIDIKFSDCVVIGDTPRDIECAKPYGARAIAVATGPFSSAELSAAGADAVFEDLSDTGEFLSALGDRVAR
jgi:phosphoglycolate phosphatase-like HAD superfamily hydrolase